jgi:hypothetical protein
MRGVGVRGSLLACVCAAAILLSVQARAFAAEQVATLPPEASTPASPSADDYYTRRAKSILKAEKSTQMKPHPLAASYPGMDIVVCEAGCRGRRRVDVVFMRPRPESTQTTTESMMLPTSGSDVALAGAVSPTNVPCIAGCYGRSSGEDDFRLRAFLAREPARVPRVATPKRDPLSPIR